MSDLQITIAQAVAQSEASARNAAESEARVRQQLAIAIARLRRLGQESPFPRPKSEI
jgi:hypothetical protein